MKVVIITVISMIVFSALTACTTPRTTLKHKKTGQVVTCGGSSTGSFVGGAIGYHVQKGDDQDCVSNYKGQGFKVIKTDKE